MSRPARHWITVGTECRSVSRRDVELQVNTGFRSLTELFLLMERVFRGPGLCVSTFLRE